MTLAVARAIVAFDRTWKRRPAWADPDEAGCTGSKIWPFYICSHRAPVSGLRLWRHVCQVDVQRPSAAYNSFGNGAAMRISPAGFAARSEAEAIGLARAVTAVTHNHPEGIKGAEAVAVAILMARQGALKDDIRRKIADGYYTLDFTIDEIRASYHFNETCQETVAAGDRVLSGIRIVRGRHPDCCFPGRGLRHDRSHHRGAGRSLLRHSGKHPKQGSDLSGHTLRVIFDQWETFTGKHREQYRILTKYLHKLPPSSLCDPHAAGR